MNDFFNLLGDFFLNRPLTNEEQILLAILGILILTIGVIIGWIVQGLTTRRYKKELLLLRKDRDEFEVRYRAGETKQKALAKELEAVSREKVDALDRIQSVQGELSSRDVEVEQLRRSNEELSVTNQSYAGTIESLNDQVIGLKTQNEQLLERADAVVVPMADQGAAAGAGQGQESNENLNAYIVSSETRFQELEARLRAMNEESRDMLSRGTVAPANPYTGHQPVVNPELSGSTEPLVIRADTAEPGARTGNQGATEVIVQTTPSIHIPSLNALSDNAPDTDDLTLIDNIGPFLQKKLNDSDIYRYEQISKWTEADIVTYTNLIGYIPGIIQRDDWVGQARGLAMSEAAHRPGDEGELAFANSSAPTPMDAEANEVEDDLKVVEGIGPKIESILKASGIRSLGVLADTSTERLREILEEAGSRFKSQDPKTWAVQAGLAADGKLAELKAWQGELKGGK